ncbi:MAG TPA: peptidylprolyl isomerase [Candidatus Limnocylindria bacterium]
MSFRNRPILDRKHRPRWQDELRSQQLIVAGFAMAIAVALGIFGAAAWSSFYNATLRPVAIVGGTTIDRAEMTHRTDLLAAQLSASYLDIAGQKVGGVKDQLLDQQVQALQQGLQSVDQVASDTVVTGLVLEAKARELGLSVPQDELDAEVAKQTSLPERRKLSLIVVIPVKPEGASADTPPTDQAWADAKAEIDDVKAQLDGGAVFADLAAGHSDDGSKSTKGLLGWIEKDDSAYGDYFTAADGAAAGAVIGPTKTDEGWYLLRVDDVKPAGPDKQLSDLLDAAGVSDAEYRDYVRTTLLQRKFQDYFNTSVLGKYQPQREVAQIMIGADPAGAAVTPKIHIRHLLAQPLPGEQDQSAATQEQWDAALARAEALREEALKPDADWYALSEESDDAGSRTKGGYLGWYEPSSLATSFVPEFAAAAAALDVGEVSEPVKSQFGYHIIQVTERRASATELANRLVDDLRQDPDSFPAVARDESEDPVTAKDGGDLGWVIKYQFEPERQDAIFALTKVGEISDPVVTSSGIYIFKLLDTAEARFVSQAQRDKVSTGGFSRWLQELKDQAHIWLDTQFAPAPATVAGG